MTHYRKILWGLLMAVVCVCSSCSKDGVEQKDKVKADTVAGSLASTELYENVNFQDGDYTMRLYNTSLVADIRGSSLVEWAPAQVATGDGGNAQRMHLTSLGNGFYKITIAHSGMVLTVADSPLNSGAGIQQSVWTEDLNQQWRFMNIGDGYVAIVNRLSSMAINGVGPAGNPLVQRPELGTLPTYKWRVWKL